MGRYLVLVPGLLAWILITAMAVGATIWCSGEMFQEGWWGSMPHRFIYMVPGIVATFLAAIAVRWPRPGGYFLGAVGLAFALFWGQASSNRMGWEMAIPYLVVALLCIMEGWRLEKIERGQLKPWKIFPSSRTHFFFRHPRLTITLAMPLLGFIAMAIYHSIALATV